MSEEFDVVEVFLCPQCGGENFVTWDAKETKRTISCARHGEIVTIEQPGLDGEGKPTVVPMTYNRGYQFEVQRTKGVRGAERKRIEGKSWVETKTIVIVKAEV